MRRNRLLRLTFPLCVAALSCGARAADELPAVASFFQTPQISHVSLSPGGGHVAMTIILSDGTPALAVRDTAAPTNVKVVSQLDPQMAAFHDVHWINDKRIGYTVKNLHMGARTNLDEFAVDRDGGASKHLINGNWGFKPEKAIGTLIAPRMLTADYAFHSVTYDGSDDIMVEKYTWNNTDLAPASSRLYRLNTRTASLSSAFEGPQPESSKEWITDGNAVPRIVMSEVKGRCITSYRQPEDTSWQQIDSGECFKSKRFTPLFFDGADTLFVQAVHKDLAALFRYDLKTRKLAAEPIMATPGFDFAGAPVIDYASKRLVGIHFTTDAGGTVWLDAALKADQAKIDAALPGFINTVQCARQCLASPVLLVSSTSDRQPTQYALYTRASGQLVGLGSIHPALKAAQSGARGFYRYTARDGRVIPAYVTMPALKAAGPQPAVVLVHGGPGVRGASWEWDQQAAFLSSRGYVVIQPEFRGGAGFGAAHFEAGWKQWGGAMQDDLADAARWAVKQGWADPWRIGIMGASYGGYATLMGLIKEPQLFRAGVEWAGVSDLKLMFTSFESDASEENLGYSMRTLIGDPDTDAELFRKNSPLLRAAELKQPLLMAHGGDDRRVPVDHANRFANALRGHNDQATLLIYDNEGHGWRTEQTRVDFWGRVDAFLDKNLKHAQ
ncbi:dienelactone hydrolase [Duganella sp. 1411]|uniref:alpha/beta hydrolase family protein n=1 Tax=Duganella sp. 1411 TaxID=2806572 RepID=UPI001AE9E1B9|nr:prolyl oligopeptidase family serine peptidase [Duganella sp. 1411]MBP1207850.1 dienelactone hydrolase [Duganella sp. 1411]